MDKTTLQAEINKLNVSQRSAIRKIVPSVRPGHKVRVFKAEKGAHVYIDRDGEVSSLLLGPRGRVLESRLRQFKRAS